MRLLITGGAGFIGSNFVRKALSGQLSGISSIAVLDKLTYAGNLSNLSTVNDYPNYCFIKGDIADISNFESEFGTVDAIINFAAESHVDKSITQSLEFSRTNILGLHNLLDYANNKSIRLLQVSTDEVYGSINEGSWDEKFTLAPNSPYSATKASADLLALAYFKTHQCDVVITRCSNNYGPNQFPEKLIPLFITNLLQGKQLPLYGDGENIRDWLHVDDHCRGIHLALTKGKSGAIYNIGGGKEISNKEITKLILDKMNRDESNIKYVQDRKGHDFRYSVDWTKIKTELGYSPKVNFEDGLNQTIEWYKNNKDWWEPLKLRARL